MCIFHEIIVNTVGAAFNKVLLIVRTIWTCKCSFKARGQPNNSNTHFQIFFLLNPAWKTLTETTTCSLHHTVQNSTKTDSMFNTKWQRRRRTCRKRQSQHRWLLSPQTAIWTPSVGSHSCLATLSQLSRGTLDWRREGTSLERRESSCLLKESNGGGKVEWTGGRTDGEMSYCRLSDKGGEIFKERRTSKPWGTTCCFSLHVGFFHYFTIWLMTNRLGAIQPSWDIKLKCTISCVDSFVTWMVKKKKKYFIQRHFS